MLENKDLQLSTRMIAFYNNNGKFPNNKIINTNGVINTNSVMNTSVRKPINNSNSARNFSSSVNINTKTREIYLFVDDHNYIMDSFQQIEQMLVVKCIWSSFCVLILFDLYPINAIKYIGKE